MTVLSQEGQLDLAHSEFKRRGCSAEILDIELFPVSGGSFYCSTVTALVDGIRAVGRSEPCIGAGKALLQAVERACS